MKFRKKDDDLPTRPREVKPPWILPDPPQPATDMRGHEKERARMQPRPDIGYVPSPPTVGEMTPRAGRRGASTFASPVIAGSSFMPGGSRRIKVYTAEAYRYHRDGTIERVAKPERVPGVGPKRRSNPLDVAPKPMGPRRYGAKV